MIDARLVARLMLVLIPVGIALFLLPKNRRGEQTGGQINTQTSGQMHRQTAQPAGKILALAAAVSFCVGFYDGFFGPGTGSLFIIAFHYFLRLDLVSSSANAKLFNLASNLGALIAFVLGGKVIYTLALPLVAGNVLGNHFGSRMAVHGGSRLVRRVLVFSMCALFVSVGVKYVF